MMVRPPRGRSGITLTEILISILILGVGMVSLATLFPLGLLRMRNAQRNSRSALELRSAVADIQARSMFDKSSFISAIYAYDPWRQDGVPTTGNVYRGDPTVSPPLTTTLTPIAGPGLPVAYDPLWFNMTGNVGGANTFRFGQATSTSLPPDGSATGSSPAATGPPTVSAFGLQRITNYTAANFDPTAFVSQDDIVLQDEGPPANFSAATQAAVGSAILPSLARPSTTGANSNWDYVIDYAYSWMFTGQQTNAFDYTVYDGSIVVFNNRPFGLDNGIPAGERVVEGVFAYGNNTGGSNGYSTGDPRVVLLRWPATLPDPEVAPGSWLADVTYEQSLTATATKTASPQLYPMQRCYWYQVAKRSSPQVDPDFANFRSLVVTLTAPVRAKTLLKSGTRTPVYTNAAVLCPSVVNVFPKTFYTRY